LKFLSVPENEAVDSVSVRNEWGKVATPGSKTTARRRESTTAVMARSSHDLKPEGRRGHGESLNRADAGRGGAARGDVSSAPLLAEEAPTCQHVRIFGVVIPVHAALMRCYGNTVNVS